MVIGYQLYILFPIYFQYGGLTLHSEGGSSNEDSHVCLNLGLTDYRSFSISVTFIYSQNLKD